MPDLNEYQALMLEQPPGEVGLPKEWEDLSYLLPGRAQERGFIMLDIVYAMGYQRDPVIIFDRRGRIAHQFPDDYDPGPLDIKRAWRNIRRRVAYKG
jgi:hypothetical protein